MNKGDNMIDENAVVTAIGRYLEDKNFEIVQKLDTKQRGIDLIAEDKSTGDRILVEAKGGTSSLRDTTKYGRPFSSQQVLNRVAKGFHTAAKLRSRYVSEGKTKIALAFPDTRMFRKYVGEIESVLVELNIDVYWVSEDGVARQR